VNGETGNVSGSEVNITYSDCPRTVVSAWTVFYKHNSDAGKSRRLTYYSAESLKRRNSLLPESALWETPHNQDRSFKSKELRDSSPGRLFYRTVSEAQTYDSDRGS
jgi:hypothetical protein